MNLPYNVKNFYTDLIDRAVLYESTQSKDMSSYKEKCLKYMADYNTTIKEKILSGERRISIKKTSRHPKKSIHKYHI